MDFDTFVMDNSGTKKECVDRTYQGVDGYTPIAAYLGNEGWCLAPKRRRQVEIFEEEWDPYAVTPEDALDAARREVKRWRLEQLTHLKANAELDSLTSWFVLAWDAFRAPVFAYDEALRLARAVGVDLDTDIVGRLAEKKGSDIRLWDSAQRAAKGALGPLDGSKGLIDTIHHAANMGRTRTLAAARDLVAQVKLDEANASLPRWKRCWKSCRFQKPYRIGWRCGGGGQ